VAIFTFNQVSLAFGEQVILKDAEFAVEPGERVCLIGRNGAGKTTALRLAHGVVHPDKETIRVLGLDPVENGMVVRTRVSLLSEESSLYG